MLRVSPQGTSAVAMVCGRIVEELGKFDKIEIDVGTLRIESA